MLQNVGACWHSKIGIPIRVIRAIHESLSLRDLRCHHPMPDRQARGEMMHSLETFHADLHGNQETRPVD